MARVIILDVNETLPDLAALDPQFRRAFGDGTVRGEWFAQVIELALAAAASNAYVPFGTITDAALTMVASRHALGLSDEDRTAILGGLRAVPPHPDVRPGLDRLREAGLRLAALTNCTSEEAEAQLRHAGLRDYFEQVLSADRVRRLKPAPEVYRMAASSLGAFTRSAAARGGARLGRRRRLARRVRGGLREPPRQGARPPGAAARRGRVGSGGRGRADHRCRDAAATRKLSGGVGDSPRRERLAAAGISEVGAATVGPLGDRRGVRPGRHQCELNPHVVDLPPLPGQRLREESRLSSPASPRAPHQA